MTAFNVSLAQQITFVLGRHDPLHIFDENPDAPPDEYESEAQQILADLTVRPESVDKVRAVVQAAFADPLDDEAIDERAVHRAARDIYRVLLGEPTC